MKQHMLRIRSLTIAVLSALLFYTLSYCVFVEREIAYSNMPAGLGYPEIHPAVSWDRSNRTHWLMRGYTPVICLHRIIWPEWWQVRPDDYKDYASRHPLDAGMLIQITSQQQGN